MLQNGQEKRLANCVQRRIIQQVETLTWIATLFTVKQNITQRSYSMKTSTRQYSKHNNSCDSMARNTEPRKLQIITIPQCRHYVGIRKRNEWADKRYSINRRMLSYRWLNSSASTSLCSLNRFICVCSSELSSATKPYIFNIADKLLRLQARSARNMWRDFDTVCLQPLWASCSHKCTSVTKQCNLVPTKTQWYSCG